MSTKPAVLRAEPHPTLGTTLVRDAGVIVERWAERAVEEQPSAKRAHHDALLDHLPTLIWELGRALADATGRDTFRHTRPANVHGDQRWEIGWSIEEVVRDYQLLRVVLLEHLDATLGRPVSVREVMALGVFIDDAVAASVAAYTACQAAAAAPAPARPPAADRDGLLDVLGVVGHELRNPMAPIGNALQILKVKPADPATVERARALMERQFRVMTRLVDDLLDLPRLDRGKARLQTGPVDLTALLRTVAADRSADFDAAGVALALALPAEPLPTVGDAARLTQVFGNLLGNALKFTDRGGRVRVTLRADRGNGRAVCTIQDTGVGIDPPMLPRVFDAFVQADRAVDRTRGGLGLGLALVKGFVELHGGAVTAASGGPGRGSEFTVELPLIALPAATPAEPPAPPAGKGKRVLVVEDNRDSAESLKLYLELLGHAVSVAHSGPDGVAAAGGVAFDAVVCDIGLPGMSGHAVCAALRQLPGLAHTRFIALTGHAPDAGGQAAAGAGFDEYLLKPVDPAHLAAVISGPPAATGG